MGLSVLNIGASSSMYTWVHFSMPSGMEKGDICLVVPGTVPGYTGYPDPPSAEFDLEPDDYHWDTVPYKVMSDEVDSGVYVHGYPSSGQRGVCAACITLRGVRTSNPFDIAVVAASGVGSNPSHPEFCPIRGELIILVAIKTVRPDYAASGSYVPPPGYEIIGSSMSFEGSAPVEGIAIAVATKEWSPGDGEEQGGEWDWPISYADPAREAATTWKSYVLVLRASSPSQMSFLGTHIGVDRVAFSDHEQSTDRSSQCFSGFMGNTLSFGRITSEWVERFYIWNGTQEDCLISSKFSPDMAAGVFASDIAGEIGKHVSIPASVTALKSGMPSFETELIVDAASSESGSDYADSATIAMVGQRADVHHILCRHDWSQGLSESLAWKTDVLIARDRTEQRIRMRTTPRRTWGLRYLLSGAERRKIEAMIGLRAARSLLLPLWRQAIALPAAVAPGQGTIELGVSDPDWAPGEPVVIWSGPESMEVHTIKELVNGSVSTVIPFQSSWPADGITMIAPARYCLPLAGRNVSRFTGDVGILKLSLTAIHDQWPAQESFADTYQGLPVCPETTVWADGDEATGNQWQALDNETGLIEYDIQSVEPILSRDAKFLVHGESRVATFLAWLSFCAGRARPFWLRSDEWACNLAESASAGAITLLVVAAGYTEHWYGGPAKSVLEIRLIDGSVIRRQIVGSVDLGDGSERLTLDSGLPTGGVQVGDITGIYWLERSRLDADELDLQFLTWDCLETTIPVVGTP